MSLRVALAEKFPEAPESEILKVRSKLCSLRDSFTFHFVQATLHTSPLCPSGTQRHALNALHS